MEKNNNKEQEIEKFPFEVDSDDNKPALAMIPDKAFKILDSAIEGIEKKLKTSKTNEIVEKAKVSKPSEKLSEKEPLTEVIPDTTLKEQYVEGISGVLILINPFLIMKGIEPITDQEIRDLIYAIFDIFEPSLKQIVKQAETNISFIKNIRKLLNLGKAVWQIIAPRLQRVRDMLTELKAKREVLKLQQLAKPTPKPRQETKITENVITNKDD